MSSVICPHCSVQLAWSEDFAGATVTCSQCGNPLIMPELPPIQTPLPEVPRAIAARRPIGRSYASSEEKSTKAMVFMAASGTALAISVLMPWVNVLTLAFYGTNSGVGIGILIAAGLLTMVALSGIYMTRLSWICTVLSGCVGTFSGTIICGIIFGITRSRSETAEEGAEGLLSFFLGGSIQIGSGLYIGLAGSVALVAAGVTVIASITSRGKRASLWSAFVVCSSISLLAALGLLFPDVVGELPVIGKFPALGESFKFPAGAGLGGEEYADEANLNTAKTQIGLFKGPLNDYRRHTKTFPTTEQGLQALITPPGDGDESTVTGWRGPYLYTDTLPKDPWGNEYQYAYEGGDSPRIWSWGPDKKDGTDDDIRSWSSGTVEEGEFGGAEEDLDIDIDTSFDKPSGSAQRS